MPDNPFFDIARLDNWCGFRPGMTRTEVVRILKDHGVEEDACDDDYGMATVNNQDFEFWFATDGSERLRQISTDDNLAWNGTAIMDERIDAALRAMEPHGPALWQTNDAIGDPFRETDSNPETPPTDEKLLTEGTIWLPDRGLGLVINEGEVIGVAWRGAQDLPKQFAGPVTDSQRQLSLRPDLEEYLQGKRAERSRVDAPKDPLAPLRWVWTIFAIVTLVFIGRAGFKDTVGWASAPVLTGKLLGIERGPMKQFLEYLPPAVTRYIPERILKGGISGKRPQTDLYRVEYHDPAGEGHEVTLESADFYVAPRELGAEVQVTYLAGDPPRVKGPSRARDGAFLDYMPWVICLGGVYLFGQLLISLLPLLRRLLPLIRKLVPKATIDDPSRPELR